MNRRSFLGRIGKAVAGAVIAAHMDLGSLVPVEPVTIVECGIFPDYYCIEWPVVSRGYNFGSYAEEIMAEEIMAFSAPGHKV